MDELSYLNPSSRHAQARRLIHMSTARMIRGGILLVHVCEMQEMRKVWKENSDDYSYMWVRVERRCETGERSGRK